MYTVARFQCARKNSRKLKSLGESLNRVRKNTFVGLDRIGGRFSCVICDSDNWKEHLRQMVRFLDRFKASVQLASREDIDVEFDVAIEPEDAAGKPYISLETTRQVIKRLAKDHVELTFTYYVPGATNPGASTRP
jgi:hypothetical protein